MCGRAAQTYRAASAAADSLGVEVAQVSPITDPTANAAAKEEMTSGGDEHESVFDNYNMSPGMDAFVIWKDGGGKLQMSRKTWGLVTRPGSQASPIPSGMNLHFSNMMFNARSDTLWEKPTFSRLAAQGRSCLVIVDGFYEWKDLGKGSKKQPYFVYRKQLDGDNNKKLTPADKFSSSYLLMAGLWTTVPTGRRESDQSLDTFTILTTDVCEPLKWLHTRMPLCIWDDKMALEWLDHPTAQVHRRLEQASIGTPAEAFDWHAVSPDMSSLKYRSSDALKPVAASTKITAFFQKKGASGETTATPGSANKGPKRLFGSAVAMQSPPKKQKAGPQGPKKEEARKKGPLDSFFAKKNGSN